MKYYIFTLVISSFIFSCTSSNQKHFNEYEKAIDNVEEDTHVSDIEDEHYPIDSIELYNLIPKRAIIKDVFDKAIDFFNKREVYLYLNDYDYFYITLFKCNNSDTICYVGYDQLRLLELNNHSHYHLLGYIDWGQYPVLVYGNAVFSFYNHGDKTKVFYRGDLVDWSIIDDDHYDIAPNEVAFVISGNRFWDSIIRL
jgi:hypothetical protein